MERVLIIGCSGAGKSTLARALSEKMMIPAVHLDKLWWRDNWEHIPREEFDERLAREMEKDKWIMDGDYSRTLPVRLARCDTVIYLDFNRFICLKGAVKRVISHYGKTRPDMGGNCRERFDWHFLAWIWNYNKRNRRRNYELLDAQKDKTVIIFKNHRQVRKWLAVI